MPQHPPGGSRGGGRPGDARHGGQGRHRNERGHGGRRNRPPADGGGNGNGGYTPTLLLYRHSDLDDCAKLQRLLVPEPRDGSHDASLADNGLRFTKFFGRWRKEDPIELLKRLGGDKRTDPVLDWLNPHVVLGQRPKGKKETLRVGDAAQLQQAAKRMGELARKRGGETFELDLSSRLLTGIGLPHPTENGFLFHPTLGVPYLRGTALKQVARDWAEENEAAPRDKLDLLFGAVDARGEPKNAGAIAFLDALPTGQVTLTAEQITAHYGPYYAETDPAAGSGRREPADWHEPNPVTLLAVHASHKKKLRFQFGIIRLRSGVSDGDLADAETWLREGLIQSGIGAKTTLGYGRFEVPSERTAPARGDRPSSQAGQELPAGTRLSWLEEDVVTTRAVTLRPGIAIPVRFVDDGSEDRAPIGDIAELRHIR